MDFALTVELIEFQELIRQMATDQIGPRAAEVDQSGEYPQDLFEVFRNVGLLGLCIPPEYGGSGAGLLGLALAIEELSRVSVAAAAILELARTSSGPLILAPGATEVRERYLPGIADGTQRAAVALEEDGAVGVLDIATAAARDADGWVLSGTKCSVLGGRQADWFVVFAKTSADPASRTRDSVSAFVVEARSDGVTVGEGVERTGVRGVTAAEVALDQVRVEAGCVIGAVGSGLRLAGLVANVARPLAAVRAVGLAEAALMCAAENCDGESPEHSVGLRGQIAALAIEVEAARLLALRGAWMIDVGQTDRRFSAQLALASHRAAGVAVDATELAARIVGSGGEVDRWSRDARQLRSDVGDPDAHLELVAEAVLAHELWWGDGA